MCLDFEVHTKEMGYWTEVLKSGKKSVLDIAVSIAERNNYYEEISDSNYIELIYKTLLQKEPEEEGNRGWLAFLEPGGNRDTMIKRFVKTEDFREICDRYGALPHRQ
jgi:hypothetical protein